ncbi:MAG: hypothetical protein ABSB59_40635 [Streptosporangiaceae bacterium]|jgi:hypothetical protein
MGLLHVHRYLGEAGRVEEAAARHDARLVNERRHDEAEDAILGRDGALEGGGVQDAGDADNRRAGHAYLGVLDRPDLDREPQLHPAGGAVGEVVPPEVGRQHGQEPLDDLRGRDLRGHDDQQAVTAVLAAAGAPDRPEGQFGHGRERLLYDLVGLGAAIDGTERHHIAADHRAVLPGQRARAGRADSRRGDGQLSVKEGLVRAALAQPGEDLVLHDLEHRRIGANEGGEVRCRYDQGHHRLHGHHGGRARIHLQGGPFPDQLAGAAHGHDPLGAVLVDADLRQAAENDGYMVAVFPFLHEPGTCGEYPLVGLCPESALLIRVEGVPEINHGLVLIY